MSDHHHSAPLRRSSDLIADQADCTVRRVHVSETDNAVYLITSRSSGQQILIDAADDVAAIIDLIRDGAQDVECEPRLKYVVTTHAHWDHTRAVAEIAHRTGARVVIGKDDAEQLREERGVVADMKVGNGETLRVDGIEVELIALRGHTPGSIAIALTTGSVDLLFTGDSLFPGGGGNTWGDPARFTSLLDDVSERLFARFPDQSRVFPGHGAETTLGAERPSIPEWRARGW